MSTAVILRAREATLAVILKSAVFAASRRMAASPCVVSILRDARKGALLRMMAEIAQALRMTPTLRDQ